MITLTRGDEVLSAVTAAPWWCRGHPAKVWALYASLVNLPAMDDLSQVFQLSSFEPLKLGSHRHD